MPAEEPRGRAGPGSDRADRLLVVLQRFAVRSGRGPLGRLWALVYASFERLIPAFILRGRDGSAYVRGGTGRDQPIWGLSDIDVFCIVAEDREGRGVAREACRERWRTLHERFPLLNSFFDAGVYEESDVAEEVGEPYLTFGLDAPPDAPRAARALYYDGRPGSGDLSLHARPGLFGPLLDWRLAYGAPRLPPTPAQDADRRRIGAWSELQFWWTAAFTRCSDPTHASTSYLAAKLIAEPLRILLFLDHGLQIWRRPEVLAAALERYPRHREAALLARELIAAPLGPGDRGREEDHRQAFEAAFPHWLVLSREIATRLDADVGTERTEVRLSGAADPPLPTPGEPASSSAVPTRPMCDWRVLCVQRWPDSVLEPVHGEVTPALVADCMTEPRFERTPVIKAGDGLLLMPEPLSTIRRIASPFSDPVSTALISGSSTARFPLVPGFAAGDWARRAVAEREAQLATTSREPTTPRLGLLLAAARAGLFAESFADGDPALPLTGTAAARRLTERDPRRGAAIEACLAVCAGAETEVHAAAAAELEEAVADLLERADAGARARAASCA